MVLWLIYGSFISHYLHNINIERKDQLRSNTEDQHGGRTRLTLLSCNDLAMAKTTEQPDLINRFKELWINELVPTIKKDLLTELKTEIGKQMELGTERF